MLNKIMRVIVLHKTTTFVQFFRKNNLYKTF